MKQFFSKLAFYLAGMFPFVMPLLALAEDQLDPPGSGSGFSIKITNPLRVGTIEELLDLALNLIITIGIPIVVLTIMWSGFLFIRAQGKPADIDNAKKNLMYVLLGTAIVLGVFSILSIIQATIRAIGA